MVHKISAEKIFDGNGRILIDSMIVLDDRGCILSVENLPAERGDIRFADGWICPGFVNTHCHLELSHMKGKVDTGTGLIPFIKDVVTRRDADPALIEEAIEQADRDMYESGIVAVGDISNKTDTAAAKSCSPMRYYTFVEMFDFMQEHLAEATFGQYKAVYDTFEESYKNKKSIVPHAPYSVSDTLYDRIREANTGHKTISVHNEETPDEMALFLENKGGFPSFFGGFGMSLAHWKATGQTPIFHLLQKLDPRHKTLFVHNTLTTGKGIQAAHDWSDNVYWATCANANLYIENRLPDYRVFIHQQAKMTIGTDSLTSNWQLSVWEEIKTIRKYASYVPLTDLITWATKNGAEALGFDDVLGTIEPGKTPGLVVLKGIQECTGQLLLDNSVSERFTG